VYSFNSYDERFIVLLFVDTTCCYFPEIQRYLYYHDVKPLLQFKVTITWTHIKCVYQRKHRC